jgi:hypothetical protein
VEWTGPKNVPFYNSLKARCAGQHLELFAANTWYDPKYGMPPTIEKFNEEHRLYIEDNLAS